MKPTSIFVSLPCALLLSFCPACSSGPADSAAADAGSDASEPPDDAAPACNALVNSAPVVTVQQVAEVAPPPEGGSIADGTYTLVQVSIFTGVNGPSGPAGTAQTTLQVSGGVMQVVTAGQPARRTLTFTTHGTEIDGTDSCPDAIEQSAMYTAVASNLVIYLDGGTDDAGARTVVEGFTKAP